MTAMQVESTTRKRSQEAEAQSLRDIFAQMKVELAELETCLARIETDRLREQLAWERAYRRRGLLGRLF